MSHGFALSLFPPEGIMLIDSVPPASTTRARPARIESAASAIACRPDEQKRLMVIAETSTGRPARRLAMRATLVPCSASGIAQPRITSSISAASKAGTRCNAPWIAVAARSSGRVVASVPLGALPTAVRTAAAIKTSVITFPCAPDHTRHRCNQCECSPEQSI